MKRASNIRVWIFVIVLICVGAGIFFSAQRQAPMANVVILPLMSPERKAPWKAVADHGRSWLRRLRLLGPAKTVMLSVTIIDFKTPLVLSNLTLPKAEFSNTNGVQVWILSDGGLVDLGRSLEQTPGAQVISRPRILTADGIQGEMSVTSTIPMNGTNQNVGLVLKCLPRARQDSTDLTSVLTFTEAVTNRTDSMDRLPVSPAISIRTNVAVASRIQIPKGRGAFLLNTDHSAPDGKMTGVLISSAIQQAKK